MPRRARAAPLSSINLNLLVALDALLQTQSVTLAAKQISVTPSAISHSLAELRELLADPLLVRVGRDMALSPRAEALALPLRRALFDLERVVHDRGAFDPATTARRFVMAAPDFLSALLLPKVLEALAREAPGITVEIVPTERRDNAWRLESGEIDFALGAVVDDAPGMRRMDLCTEGFACAVREGHPTVRGPLTLDAYCATSHLLITLGDDPKPTWIDEALAKLGRHRHVAARVRYFMTAPLVVARTDLLMTGPEMLLRYFAELVPLRVLAPPIALPTYPEELYWHERFDEDPAHRWMRDLLKASARGLGKGSLPERRRWNLGGSSELSGAQRQMKKGQRRRVAK